MREGGGQGWGVVREGCQEWTGEGLRGHDGSGGSGQEWDNIVY